MDSAGLPPTSNATTENPDLLGKRAELQTTPEHTRDGQSATSAEGSIHTDIGKDQIMSEPLMQITHWTLFSQNEDSSIHSKDNTGRSAESVLTLTSSQPLMPLEWKTRSQGTGTYFSDGSLESIDEENKPVPDSNQEIVDDIIEDEADFKVCSHVLNHNLSANYSVNSRTNFILHPGSPNPNDTKDPQQGSDGTQCMFVTCPRTEKLSEFGTPVNRIHNPGKNNYLAFCELLSEPAL